MELLPETNSMIIMKNDNDRCTNKNFVSKLLKFLTTCTAFERVKKLVSFKTLI